ncbi:MAG TPA: transglycosylase SLT domain-containing protein [Burkholderiaceae bacterium]|nr:transglycosylase SLT domain-containing protein [Burkholderiaceae bacterium]
MESEDKHAADNSRRKWLKSAFLLPTLLLISEQSQAGGQIEEPLADAVRIAMRNAVHSSDPPIPEFKDTPSYIQYLRWLGEMSERLKPKKRDFQTRKEFLQTVWYESKRAGLDTALVLGLIQVESGFKKYAISWVGARGYMQIMPFWLRVLAEDTDKHSTSHLFNMQTNIRFGCVILRHYLDRENGNLFLALGRYNGSRGKAAYPDAVLAAKKQWEFAG